MTYRPRNAVALCLDFDSGEWDREEEPGRCSECGYVFDEDHACSCVIDDERSQQQRDEEMLADLDSGAAEPWMEHGRVAQEVDR